MKEQMEAAKLKENATGWSHAHLDSNFKCGPCFEAGFTAGWNADKWIEIKSEADLPKEDGEYQVSAVHKRDATRRAVFQLLNNDGHWTDDDDIGRDINDYWDIVAYQPLPKPFGK